MDLGCFSISLSVKDINQSKAFYEKLGFKVFAGDIEHKYLIMKNGSHNIGIFEGMFEGNMLTFNPGWDQDAQALSTFDDIREINQQLKANQVEVSSDTFENEQGPASFSVTDPDGNVILFDQHR